MSFNFGTPKTVSGFTIPTTTTASSGGGGFQFGGAAGDAKSTKPGINLTFTPQPSLATTASSTAPPGFSLPSATATPQFGFSAANTAIPTPQISFSATTIAAAPPQFSFTATTTTATPPQFSFAATSTTASVPQFNLGSIATTVPATTANTLSFSLGTTTTPLLSGTVTPSLTTTTAVTSSVFSLSGAALPKQSTTTTIAITAPVSTSTTPATTTTSGPSITPGTPYTPGATISYSTLEDLINKWTIYLEDETKHFTNQAKQMNAWDRLLITNSEKILYLSNGIERVKQLQEQLDQELDFVVAQQKELLDLIQPLEKELTDIPIADMDRHRTYQMAETLDAELKQMSEDLKEIIEHLNESNKHQELSNPMYQIGSILNVHMNSLQWIDRQITKITTHLDQISKMHDMNKRNHEINLQKTYE